MNLIESAYNIELNDNNKYFLEEIEAKYKDYIKLLETFDEKALSIFLESLKKDEIRNNHKTENEDPLMITFYTSMMENDSLTTLINILHQKDKLTMSDVKKLHKILMEGTEKDVGAGEFRQKDVFVGAFNPDGTQRIDYVPIAYDAIEENMAKVLEIINSNNQDNVFINPFIIHGLIAALQPFMDGNTRTARLLQHSKIWTNTNMLYNKKFALPTIYLSENYWRSRGDNRYLINQLAIEENNEAWNAWFKHNFYMVDEQLFHLNNVANKARRKIK
ncbi:MAG: Fic family protein [Bacilli bacterium]|nr:Fic family protein [Bacilli bacterium]